MIFLSASIPDPQRNAKYYDTADPIAIRDAVRALATVVIPRDHLVWGGHPAITPLIRFILDTQKNEVKEHVTLYQSNFFRNFFPPDNEVIENRIIVPENKNQETSLRDMRERIFRENKFKAGVFIGGMEGVENEFKMFREFHPKAPVFPIASTGAAAKLLYEESPGTYETSLLNEYAYMALFRSLFKGIVDFS